MKDSTTPILASELFEKLPPPPDLDLEGLMNEAKAEVDVIIVLDDDPTGTQTVYDIPVLTSWETEIIEKEIILNTPLFFILTNSRSLTSEEAERLGMLIGQRIHQVTIKHGKKCLVISRSDSTLRGHYPKEVHALERGLSLKGSIHFIIPAFFEGGRYTINDVHYVQKKERLIPAAQTPFAKDKVFGYQSSRLVDWVIEKWDGNLSTGSVRSLSISELRKGDIRLLVEKIHSFQIGDVCVVNAAAYVDLQIATIAILQSNCLPIMRTAASFVSAIASQPLKRFLNAREIISSPISAAGLIIIGSYVPKTTLQLQHLLTNKATYSIEIDVQRLIDGTLNDASIFTQQIEKQLVAGDTVVLHTSRQLVHTHQAHENLAIGKEVSSMLTKIVEDLSVRPQYIIAKGGITSSDIATKSLKVKRAKVLGQIASGIPVWSLGNESKFPGMPYIVFPGNVGEEDHLTKVVDALTVE